MENSLPKENNKKLNLITELEKDIFIGGGPSMGHKFDNVAEKLAKKHNAKIGKIILLQFGVSIFLILYSLILGYLTQVYLFYYFCNLSIIVFYIILLNKKRKIIHDTLENLPDSILQEAIEQRRIDFENWSKRWNPIVKPGPAYIIVSVIFILFLIWAFATIR